MTDMYTQMIRPLDRLLHEKRMPVLFVGSGTSQRYCSLKGWDALLQEVSEVIGLSRIQLNAMKNQLEMDNPGLNVNPSSHQSCPGLFIRNSRKAR